MSRDMFGNDLTATDSFSTPRPPCKGCGKPFEQHWAGTEGVFCANADYPDEHKLFGPVVSRRRYEPAEVDRA